MSIRKTPGAQQVEVNIVGGSTFGRYSKISSEKTYNMFISDGFLVNFAGFKRVLELSPGGQSRGLFRSVRGGFAIAVVDASVYQLAENLVPVLIGELETTSGDVYIDENLNSMICIVDGLNIYIYNYTLPPELVIQEDIGFIPSCVCFHSTFFLFGNSDTTANGALWYVYEPDPGTVDPPVAPNPQKIVVNSILAISTKPDYAICVQRIPGQGNNVLVMGTTVCEMWVQVPTVNAAGESVAYQRIVAANIDYGCASISTIASSDQYIAWLGVNENNSPVIMVYTGNGAEPISTDGIDYVLEQIQYPAQSTAFFFRQDGHSFYQLTFFNPEDNLTLVYDFTTKNFFHLSDWNLNYHPARQAIYFNGTSYFMSLNNASLYEFSSNYTTYNEQLDGPETGDDHEIPRIRICKNIRTADSRRFIANSLVITMEQGTDPGIVGLDYDTTDYIVTENTYVKIYDEDGTSAMVTENAHDYLVPFGVRIIAAPPRYQPRVDLSLSYNGGISFGNYVSRDLHPQGWQKNVITWEKLGAANDLVLKFRFLGTSRFIVHNGILEIY